MPEEGAEELVELLGRFEPPGEASVGLRFRLTWELKAVWL